jgi:PAS domain S-box-containing protein
MSVLGRILDVPSTDPDDRRRSRLLNILLLGVSALTVLTLAVTIIADLAGLGVTRLLVLYLGLPALLAGLALIYIINRYRSGLLAGSLFILFLTIVLAFGDEAQEVVNGRSLFTFAVPILMASVLLRSYASFIVAGLISLLLAAIALSIEIVPNTFAMLGFFAIALVSWLSARSLEQALVDLRTINKELDQRVDGRTRDLAAALAREQTETNKNQAVLEGIADGVIVFDNQGRAIVANPAMTQLINRSPETIVGHDIRALMAEEVDADSREMIFGLLGDREAPTPSMRFEWGKKTLSVSVAPVRASDRVTGTVAVFRDYTREAEVERMKGAFMSMISHDLRTPLGAIVGYADMLQEAVYGPLSEPQLDVMERINANTQRLLSLVNNLLDQTQIEAGRLTFQISSFDPRKLLADMESVMGVLAQSKGLQLDCQVADAFPPDLSADRERLHQILVNLVNNAIKFTEQGRVDVRIYRADGDRWAIDVSDTGPGIPPAAQEYIFEPFRQVDDSITRTHAGVGLGLSIVKQLTGLMGGEITLTSEVGQGSTFTIVLPFTPVREVTT